MFWNYCFTCSVCLLSREHIKLTLFLSDPSPSKTWDCLFKANAYIVFYFVLSVPVLVWFISHSSLLLNARSLNIMWMDLDVTLPLYFVEEQMGLHLTLPHLSGWEVFARLNLFLSETQKWIDSLSICIEDHDFETSLKHRF